LNPSVSVVIPTYNGSAFIAEALASVFAQTLPPREIIVVDDCSTDDTCEIVCQFAIKSTVPCRLIRLDRNSGGPAKPINVGIEAAKTPFIAVLEQDDVYLPTKLEVQSAILAGNPSLSAVVSARQNVDECGAVSNDNALRDLAQNHARQFDGYHVFENKVFLRFLLGEVGNAGIGGFPSLLFRKSVWQRKGCDESLRISGDTEFACWLATQGDIAFIDRVHYERASHSNSLSGRNRKLTFLEDIKAKRRYISQETWLFTDEAFSNKVRDLVKGAAYWSRREGYLRDSWEYYRLLINVWGWRRDCVSGIMKLLPSLFRNLI
jgi:glycosyltransferase involved in cell wall biosynthesis